MSFYQLIFQFVKTNWRQYLLSAWMLLMVSILTVWIPKRIATIIDGLVSHTFSHADMVRELSLIFLMGLACYVFRVGWRLHLFSASFRLGMQIRLRLYERLTLQSPAFFQQQRTGDLMALGTNDADAIESAAGDGALAGFDGVITFLLVIGMMAFGVDWRLAFIALLPFPFMAYAFRKISQHVHDTSVDALNRFGDLNQHVQQSLTGIRTLRVLGLEKNAEDTFSNFAQKAAQASWQEHQWESSYEPVVGVCLAIAGTSSLAYGAYLVWQQELTVGNLTAFTMYLGQLIWPMFAAGWVFSLLERGKAAWSRLRPVLEKELSIPDEGDAQLKITGDLVFSNVSLTYDNHPALKHIALQLPAGRVLGVVGPTGAGKSSLLRLILRQYAYQEGVIQWGQHELDAYTLKHLRDQINWVPQEAFLFSASIADNIALSHPEASFESIQYAAKIACIHDDIMRFPMGYQTPVGEKGITLSGGQKQRIAIARALLTYKPLILLDDALSAVDIETETHILQHLKQLKQDRPELSMIVVSHRLSAVKNADHIIVLHDGEIVEQGTHQTLLERENRDPQAWYAKQWRYQQIIQELENDDELEQDMQDSERLIDE